MEPGPSQQKREDETVFKEYEAISMERDNKRWIRVRAVSYKNRKPMIDVREWFNEAPNGDKNFFTKRGVRLDAKRAQSLLDSLQQFLTDYGG